MQKRCICWRTTCCLISSAHRCTERPRNAWHVQSIRQCMRVPNKTARPYLRVPPGVVNYQAAFSSAKAYDPYKILEVEPGSSAAEVRKAYLRLSKLHHPDFNPGDERSEEKFVLINNAFRKIMERLNSEEASESEDAEGKPNKPYDFTISPLGIETEEPPKRRINFRAIGAFIALAIGISLSKQYFLDDALERLKDRFTPQQTYAERRNEIRQALISQHNKERHLEEARQDMLEAMYGKKK